MTTNDPDTLWRVKFAARTHDPAEKALVLLRDPAGHEGGTVRALQRLAGLVPYQSGDGEAGTPLSGAEYTLVQRADWWAAAADRPQWPMEEITVAGRDGATRTLAVASWAQVRWAEKPVLIHPLSGFVFDLKKESGGLGETDFADIKDRSHRHQRTLIDTDGSTTNWRRSVLALWRFGPELREEDDQGRLGELWKLLPADTRVPDHSIWDHLDLVSAFAGAFAGDPNGEAALLSVAIGPVQGFIEAARTTSDLWAGSHLLSRLMWEAIKPVAEALGPDAVVFPRLRGVPQVDLWLRDACGLPAAWFEDATWAKGGTDANPLFAATLPNRFVAIVPAGRAEALARAVTEAARAWLRELGEKVVDELLREAGIDSDAARATCMAQMQGQLAGFPEVHWAVVPFSLVKPRDAARQTDLDVEALKAAAAPFFGVTAAESSGFLDTPAWKVLQGEVKLADGTRFFAPNPGVLYPAVQELAERALAAAKAARPFDQRGEEGWRCSLTGETEWLTTDRAQLKTSYRQQTDTLWAKIGAKRPAWARKGEHLGALPAIKRLWPSIFAREVGRDVHDSAMQRFVISTHTMALAGQLDTWMERGAVVDARWQETVARYKPDAAALPRRLVKQRAADVLARARLVPGLLERAAELEDEAESENLRETVRDLLGDGERLETYYGLCLMDGDRMGEWMSGGGELTYSDSFHPQVRTGFDRISGKAPALAAYANQKRALSPGRHLAISGALNDFSLTVARHVVEEDFRGRLIYAGGDDVLAMLPVADLLPAMERLCYAYSGVANPETDGAGKSALTLMNGFALLHGRLMRMMGKEATASCGAVIAHHQAPLAAVLRELRAAEKRAKGEGGRDAFCLTVIKRSGGALTLTAKWGEPVRLLGDLRDFLADPGVSRRAVYNSLEWLKDLPAGNGPMLQSLLHYQLDRQADKPAQGRHPIATLAQRLATPSQGEKARDHVWLANFLGVAEFLARETRSGA